MSTAADDRKNSPTITTTYIAEANNDNRKLNIKLDILYSICYTVTDIHNVTSTTR